jgi:hypothetical protein
VKDDPKLIAEYKRYHEDLAEIANFKDAGIHGLEISSRNSNVHDPGSR